MGAERRHPVLSGGQRDVAGRAREAMAVRSTFGVELADDRRDRSPPRLDPGALHLGQPLVEDLVHVSPLLIRDRCGRGGRGIGDAGGDRAAAEGAEHARHRADEATGGGEARARGGGGTVGRQGDVRRGAPIGLADELLERREEVILVRDVVAGCVDPISAMGFGEGDEGACFERGEGAEHAVDHVEEVLDLLPWPGPHLEHLLRIDGHGGQQVVDVPEHLGERGGASPVQRSQSRLGSGALRSGLRGDRRGHGSMLPRAPSIRKGRRKLWMQPPAVSTHGRADALHPADRHPSPPL